MLVNSYNFLSRCNATGIEGLHTWLIEIVLRNFVGICVRVHVHMFVVCLHISYLHE